jgi:hypothetical protein
MSVEIFGLAWFAIQEGEFFYVRTQKTSEKKPTPPLFKNKILFHPYLGFSHPPDGQISLETWQNFYGGSLDEYNRLPKEQLNRNNYGYQSAADYPLQDYDQEYLIGIFGGSVASSFALTGQQSLIKNLQKHPLFKGKNIRVLNFSQPGYKQPQQLIALIYFLALGQNFDIIITLDGFNEVALGAKNHELGRHIAMPSMSHLIPLLGRLGGARIDIYDIEKLAQVRKVQKSIVRTENNLKANHSAGLYLINELKHSYLTWEHYDLTLDLEQDLSKQDFSRLINLNPKNAQNTDIAMEKIRELWFNSSILMSNLASTNNAQYFHFLQPNQYYSEHRMDTKPSSHFFSPKSPFLEKIELGYPMLRKSGISLVEKGIAFKDLSTLFEPPLDSYYIDTCCHFTRVGNQKIANAIATHILEQQDGKAHLP